MEEDYAAGARGLKDIMESCETDRTKLGPMENCCGGLVLRLEEEDLVSPSSQSFMN